MHVIVYREQPGRPWVFITYHSGKREDAEQSARWTEEQERRIFKHARAEAKVIDEKTFDSGRKIKGRRRQAQPEPPAPEVPLCELIAEPEPAPAAKEDESASLRALLEEDEDG